MRRVRLVALLGLVGLVTPLALSQQYYDQDENQPRRKQALPEAGFWPTQRIMELAIDRLTEQMSEQFDFDDEQLYQTQELFKERVIPWLNDNRGDLMQISNEYMEMLWEKKAPSPEQVARWSIKLIPLVDEFGGIIEDTSEEMRSFMTEDQQVQLDAAMAAWDVGTQYIDRRLGVWADGGFDPVEDWHRTPEFQKGERDRQEALRRDQDMARKAVLEDAGYDPHQPGGAAAPETVADVRRTPTAAPTRVQAPKDEWAVYVEGFIKRYQLNADQQDSARRFLKDAQERRDSYLQRNSQRIADARQKSQAAKSEPERTKADAVVQKYARPVERMFDQLKERLNRLPTRKQRLEAGLTEVRGAADSETDKNAGEGSP